MPVREAVAAAEDAARRGIKRALAGPPGRATALGASLFIYHRVGGGTRNELDVSAAAFARHVAMVESYDVLSLDAALDRLDAGDTRPSAVLTFDDGFEDIYRNAWPVLREHGLPFTIYLASAFMGEAMVWEGATAKGSAGIGLTWRHLEEMLASGLCTIGNHTHDHVRPEELTADQLDRCQAAVQHHLGVTPAHFTYPWGIPVPRLEPELRARFRSASTGELGRNEPDADRMLLRRIPVRRTDPDSFVARKLTGDLSPERAYARLVRLGKSAGLSG